MNTCCILEPKATVPYVLAGLLLNLHRNTETPNTYTTYTYYDEYVTSKTNIAEIMFSFHKDEAIFHYKLVEGSTDPLIFTRAMVPTDETFEYDRMESINPGINYLNVVIDENDLLKSEALFFYRKIKSGIALSPRDYNDFMLSYEILSNTDSNFRKGLVDVDELNTYEVQKIIERIVSLQKTDHLICQAAACTIPASYADRFYTLSFHDIHHDKEKVMQVLEALTGKPRTQSVSDSYDNYIAEVTSFLNTNAPWASPL